MSAVNSTKRNQVWREKNADKYRENNKKYYQDNKEKVLARAKRQYAENRSAGIDRAKQWHEKNPRKSKNAKLKYAFGITIDKYEEMLVQQEGVCAACKSPPDKRALAVDHCHESGLVRGLLCHPCNASLGLLRECPTRMDALKAYINNFTWLK